MADLIYKDESYAIVGVCIEVHKVLGKGFSENVYKDAIEYEFIKLGIPYEREKECDVHYKDVVLKHKFYSDFVVYDKIILEVKCAEKIIDGHKKQTLNYMSITGYKLGIIANFGEDSFVQKRVIL